MAAIGAEAGLKADFGSGTVDGAPIGIPFRTVILRALKEHGMVLADNGSPWFLSGAPDPGWNDDDLQRLRDVPGSAFEAVDVSSLEVAPTSYAVAARGTSSSSSTP